MAVMIERTRQGTIHPFHAVLLAGTVPLFLGALLSDYAYWSSYQIEWSNFASWLIIGGEVFGAAALLCAVIGLFRGDSRGRLPVIYTLVLLTMWVLGFFNALIHARDAWAVMPAGLALSGLVAVLACAATWIGFSTLPAGERP
jgi:uncharacterized membrane protein